MKSNVFFEKCIKYIAVIILGLLSILMAVFQNYITFNAGELSTVRLNGINFLWALIASVVLMYIVCNILKRVPETVIFWVMAFVYLIAGGYLITHIQMRLRYDSGICYWNALNYVEQIFSNLQVGEYFYMCPHQMGLVTYNCLLVLLCEHENFVFIINLFWIIITNFCLWRMSVLMYSQSSLIRKLVILLSFLFLPHFFYLFYAYGQVPGLGMLAIALYFVVKFIKKNSTLSFVLSLIFVGGACLVRRNYLIAGIAIVIIYFLKAIETKRVLFIIGIASTICVMILPSNILNSHYEKVADTNLDNGIPTVLYIAMGLQEGDGIERADGWFNFFNQDTYLSNECDVAISTQIALDAIGDRLSVFAQNPDYAIKFFGKKIITTWCEPTFEAIWSGPLISLGGQTEVALLKDLYSGGVSFHILAFLMKLLNVIMFASSFLFVFWSITKNKESINALELFGILFLIGGFLFHFVWETSCQYVYPYVVLLIPVAARGIDIMYAYVSNRKKGLSH